MSKEELLEIADEVVKIWFKYNCSVDEAIEMAKEAMKVGD